MAQDPAAVDEALALLVHAARERQHGEVEALHALEREVLELVQAEVARAAARVRGQVARGRAREGVAPRVARVPRVAAHGARALRLVLRVLARARLQLDGLGVVAQVSRGHQHARVAAGGRARLLRVLRLGALQAAARLAALHPAARLHGRRGGRAHARHHAGAEAARVVRRRQFLEYCTDRFCK